MKKLLLSISLLAFALTHAQQNVYNYGFSTNTADMLTAGWTEVNLSGSASATLWSVASYSIVASVSTTTAPNPFMDADYSATGSTCPIPHDQTGANNSFALVNYTSTSSTSTSGKTISNWLFSPVVNVQNGDIVTFYTRIGKYSPTNTASYADNLQFRMSTNGAATVAPTSGATTVGDYTNLLVEINPSLNLTSYPASWTQYSYTVSGLTGPTDCKFAFRYYVTNAGPNATNGDIIGIDTFSVDRPTASADSFFKNNLSISPNPTKGLLNIANTNALTLQNAVLTDIDGRIINTIHLNNVDNPTIDLSDLNTGVYFLKIETEQGVGTTKIIKN